MTLPLTFGTVCSGIGAPEAAWRPLGWRCQFMSEIEAFPRAVLSHHYPEVPLHGDFTKIEAGQFADIDVLCGGTPCQSFSIAGLRGGMADTRGNLALEYLRLAERLRPRWLVWENVPGVLSSNGGRDFGSFLGGLVQLGYGFAYRILDAQFFGLAQRRKRVFVVGYLGDWRRAAAVLFEPASLRGDSAPRRKAGERVAATLTRGAESSGKGGYAGRRQEDDVNIVVTHALRAEGFDASEDGTGRGTPLVPVSVALRGREGGGAIEIGDDKAFTLRASSGGGDKPHVMAFALGSHAGAADGDQTNRSHASGGPVGSGISEELAYSLRAGRQQSIASSAVRRLTPRECERLQGFADDYSLIPHRGKLAADGPRYKALGNSMAVPVMRKIGERITAAEASRLELAA